MKEKPIDQIANEYWQSEVKLNKKINQKHSKGGRTKKTNRIMQNLFNKCK